MATRSEKSKLEIYHYYTEHGIHDSVTHFDLSKSQIRRICRATRGKYKLPKRDNSDSYRKYTLDKDYFEVIDTEEKAYWLGFIAADGSVHPPERRLTVHLKREDREHLNKLNIALGTNRPIEDITRYDKRYDCYRDSSRVSFNSRKLLVDLEKYNIVRNKTKKYVPTFNHIPNKHHLPFWRGYVDGDGHIASNKSCNLYNFDVGGNRKTVSLFKFFIEKNLSIKMKGPYFHKIWYVRTQSAPTMDILSYLYNNAAIYLDRKYFLSRSKPGYKQQEQL